MWKLEITAYSWVEIEGKNELKKCTMHFEYDSLPEATNFIEEVRHHSDITKFTLEYRDKVVE